ncbi:GntR family transcriptional regulator [Streptomyces sp. NPDC001508]|uniref:GntR family transcriptional regulator n=1 Tax=Streptomyces sp. NPDC001508 TaxID=3154656 RepID=UPI003329158C
MSAPIAERPRRDVVRHTVIDSVVELIRNDILDGVLAPGTELPEIPLAERYGVSRRTVRQAIDVLDRVGLVRHEQHKRTTVTELTPGTVRDLYQVRRTLESAGADACTSCSDVALANLRRDFQALEHATTLGDARALIEADLRFHQGVVRLIGSQRMDRFFDDIAGEMLFAIAVLESVHHEAAVRPADALAEHEAILTALLERDAERARSLVVEHANINERLLLDIVLP